MQLENTSVNIGVPSNDICAALLPPVCLQKLPSVSFRPKTAKFKGYPPTRRPEGIDSIGKYSLMYTTIGAEMVPMLAEERKGHSLKNLRVGQESPKVPNGAIGETKDLGPIENSLCLIFASLISHLPFPSIRRPFSKTSVLFFSEQHYGIEIPICLYREIEAFQNFQCPGIGASYGIWGYPPSMRPAGGGSVESADVWLVQVSKHLTQSPGLYGPHSL